MLKLANGALNFVAAGHEDEDVSLGPAEIRHDGFGGDFPRRVVAGLVAEVLDVDGKRCGPRTSVGGMGRGSRRAVRLPEWRT